jgi:hypothetical protein
MLHYLHMHPDSIILVISWLFNDALSIKIMQRR